MIEGDKIDEVELSATRLEEQSLAEQKEQFHEMLTAKGFPVFTRDWILKRGFLLLMILLALIVSLFVVTGGHLAPSHQFVLYVFLTLFLGIAFTFFTSSKGQYTSKALNSRLAGGAAVGLIVVSAIHFMIPWQTGNVKLFKLSAPEGARTYWIGESNENIREIFVPSSKPRLQISGSQWICLEFEPTAKAGKINLTYPHVDGTVEQGVFEIPRFGKGKFKKK